MHLEIGVVLPSPGLESHEVAAETKEEEKRGQSVFQDVLDEAATAALTQPCTCLPSVGSWLTHKLQLQSDVCGAECAFPDKLLAKQSI